MGGSKKGKFSNFLCGISKNRLTEAVWLNETVEKYHLNNLCNTPQNFCPMMVERFAPEGPQALETILGQKSHEFWRNSSFAININQKIQKCHWMLLLDWTFVWKRVLWKIPVCLHFLIFYWYSTFCSFWIWLKWKYLCTFFNSKWCIMNKQTK